MMKKIKFHINILIMAVITFSISCEKEKEQTGDKPSEIKLGLEKTPDDVLASIPMASRMNMPIAFGNNEPEKYFLEMPPPMNQGAEGSCVACAVGYSNRSYQKYLAYYELTGAVNQKHLCSPEFIYNQIKVSGCASGSYFVTTNGHKGGLDLLKEQGVCSWEEMPYNDTGCSEQPNASQKENAKKNKIERYERITIQQSDIKSFLLNKIPVIIGVELYRNFQNIGNNIWDEKSGGFWGRHAMVICGYDNGKNAYKVINSWGENWGDNGFVWIDYDFLEEVAFESYVTYPVNSDDPDDDLNNGLVLYYPFEGNALDMSGNNNIGNIMNGASFVANRFETPYSACKFDGIDDYISTPNSTNLQNISNGLTISCWINIHDWYNETDKEYAPICSKTSIEDNSGLYRLLIEKDNIVSTVNGKAFTINYQCEKNSWFHLVSVSGLNSLSVYINGTLVGQTSGRDWEQSFDIKQPLEIGGREAWVNEEYLNGTLDELRIYNRALSESEVKKLYQLR